MVNGQASEMDVSENLDTARRIIDDFLDISQIDVGRMKLQPTEISLDEVVLEVIEALSQFAEKKNVELKSFIPESELIVSGDRDRIVQALTDLVSSSLNSAPANSHIEIHLKDFGREVVMEVQGESTTLEDSLERIEDCKMDKIFDCFEWMKQKPDWHPELDRALSLSLAKRIMEMHGGWIWFESTDQRSGKSLCISLPKPGIREKCSIAAKEVELCEKSEFSK
jgi:signal transduction histidine kinase